ncbi:N-acetylmuramoyl-L-alanine amidase [bacterium]|nr:N-acetylmuramoyl-L-alanine amidase [bacterium]
MIIRAIYIFFLIAIPLFASATDDYSKISTKYHEFMKKKDNSNADWDDIILLFKNHVKKYPKDSTIVKANYTIANLYYKLYQKNSQQSDLNSAIEYFETVCNNFKTSTLADDGCYVLYNIYFEFRKDFEKAKKYSLKIINEYPKSDSYPKALEFITKNYPELLKKENPIEKTQDAKKTEDKKLVKKLEHPFVDILVYDNEIKAVFKSKNNEFTQIGSVIENEKIKKVFVDLKEKHNPSKKTIKINSELVEQVRFGTYKEGVERVVFDFKDYGAYQILNRGKEFVILLKYCDESNQKVIQLANEIESKIESIDSKKSEKTSETSDNQVSLDKNLDKKSESSDNQASLDKNLDKKSDKTTENTVKTHPQTPLNGFPKNAEAFSGVPSEGSLNIKNETTEVNKDDKNSNSKKRKMIIVIDPGHGGDDPGAVDSTKKIMEKDITLEVALKLQKKIAKKKDYTLYLTRDKDTTLTLDERTQFANKKKADLFISIHVNAIANKKFYGIETFYLNIAADNYSKRLESVENAEQQQKITDLQFILADLIKKANTKESIDLAEHIQSSLVYNLRRKFKNIKNLGVKNAMFYVLLDTKMPSVLVEIGFITNEKEKKQLTDDKYQEEIADSILKGIDYYFSKK